MYSHFNIKKVLNLALVLVLIVMVYCLSWVYLQSIKVYEFAGTVDKIENSVIFASGYFSNNEKTIVGKENNLISFQIKTDNNTKITRLALNIPTGVEVFNTKDLKQEELVVSLETIEKDSLQLYSIGVESLLKKGIFNNNYTAKSLYFRVPIFSN